MITMTFRKTKSLCRLSKSGKLKAVIKQVHEDFVVREITIDNEIVDERFCGNFITGRHLIFLLQKRDIDTVSAIEKISRLSGIPRERFNFAGTKDRKAVTSQLISVYRAKKGDLKKLELNNMKLSYLGRGSKVYLGNLWGNKFTITARNISESRETIETSVSKVFKELDGYFPNYFGEQRFGIHRPVTHLVGMEILKGDYERAVEIYVSEVFEETDKRVSEARKNFRKDIKASLEMFPHSHIYERMMLRHLVKNPGGYRTAIKTLPLSLQKMFIHAAQSHIFNEILSRLMDNGRVNRETKIPLVGYMHESKIEKNKADRIADELLHELDLNAEMFRLEEFPYLSSKGTYRNALQGYRSFEIISVKKDELNKGRKKIVMGFSLPKSSYATVFLKEYFDY